MIEIKSAILRSDMNASNYTKIKTEKLQEIPNSGNSDMVTFLSPMVAMMLPCFTNKSK